MYAFPGANNYKMCIRDRYKGVYNSQPGILFAILIIITIPMVIFYCVVQKQFVKGMTAGAVKG